MPHIEEAAMDRVLGRLVTMDLERLEVPSALDEVTGAVATLFQLDGAGLLLVDETQVLRCVASTDETARLLEAAQESLGVGPCIDAFVDDTVVTTSDLATEDRWPDLARLLVPSGVRAVFGLPLRLAGTTVGSMNVYSRDAYMWDDSDLAAVAAFTSLAERVLAGALIAGHQDEVIKQLQRGLEAHVWIERAVGVLMVVEDIDAAAAFERLRRVSRNDRRKVRDVAVDVVRNRGFVPSAPTTADRAEIAAPDRP